VGYVLTGVNILMHGWATYVRHAIAKKVFSILNSVAWPADVLLGLAGRSGAGRP
jgi:hypothetical protein